MAQKMVWEISDDEEESKVDDEDILVQKLVENYAKETESDKNFDIIGIREKLGSGAASCQICLVCLETVGKTEPIWSCKTCFELYHMVCIQKWSLQALQLAEMREQDTVIWHCPKCRHEYGEKERPTQYYCFCGKVRDPKPDLWHISHSCGEVCGRSLGNCKHTCILLCHPGPCPACPKVVSVRCFCGRSGPVARRCGIQGWCCGRDCNKSLSCLIHKCQFRCHSGQCADCEQKSKRPCKCGRSIEEKPCVEGKWSCQRMCANKLACGKHKCDLVCHSGPCPNCVRPGQNSCPCGKQSQDFADCIDDLPCCGDTCGRTLDCGFHECFQLCHRGPCPPCVQERDKICRCGAKHKTMPCSKPFLCDTKCRQKRQCGRHACSRRCCDGNCPPCEQICSRTLTCGRHKCTAPCHMGQCYPCPQISEVTCKCGFSKIRVPCGREKKVKPPRCRRLCTVSPDCHHSSREPHRCHFGPCPPCRQICDKTLKCAHKCPVYCHSAVLMNTNLPKEKPATPWEKPVPKLELVCISCPPCRKPVSATCIGYHETSEFPCCELRAYSCGRKCSRKLTCGNHTCQKECHEVPQDLSLLGKNCEECHEMCSLVRPNGCPHKCSNLCHPSPCPVCPQMVKEPCHCALNFKFIPCKEWTEQNSNDRQKLLSCGNQCPKLMTCGHSCLLICHQGSCSDRTLCKKRINISCKCGKRTQKRLCNTIQNGTKIDCDSTCKAEKKVPTDRSESLDSQESKPDEGTMALGPKRKRKNKKDQDRKTEKNWIKNNKFNILAVFVPVLLAVWVVYYNFI